MNTQPRPQTFAIMKKHRRPRTAGEAAYSTDSIPATSRVDRTTAAYDAAAPLVDTARFVVSTRETGYRSAVTALAELVDNALQAGARKIDVVFATGEDGLRLAVRDDGAGIRPENLQAALQFGGSDRFGDRSGMGRFGMGLPNSSLSQARRVDLYSWVRPHDVYQAQFDLDEASAVGRFVIPAAERADLPSWARCRSPHGTLVVWSRCDRLAGSRPAALGASVRAEFGRMYRYPLWNGVRITVAGTIVRPTDPLFLRTPRGVPRARPFGSELRYEVRVRGSDAASVVTVRFAELPVAAWQQRPLEDRRSNGVIGGGGVSIIRAGREIDRGWVLMGGKRRENYDDWWRCEVSFDPPLDELFGVTHSKQGIRPTTPLMDLLCPDLEATARILNRRVRDAFVASASVRQGPAERIASRREILLPQDPPKMGLSPTVREYRVRARDLASGDFFRVERRAGVRTLVINRLHPFYQRLYEPLAREDQARFAMECLLLAAVRALEPRPGDAGATARIRADWSDALAAFLD